MLLRLLVIKAKNENQNLFIRFRYQTSSYSFILVFALAMAGVSIYNNISAKVIHTEPDINDNDSHQQTRQPTPVRNEEKGLFYRIFECFDVMDNYNRLFQTSSNNKFLSSVAGMRLTLSLTDAYGNALKHSVVSDP